MAVYAASMHAVEGYSESLDHEVREHGRSRSYAEQRHHAKDALTAGALRPRACVTACRGPERRTRPERWPHATAMSALPAERSQEPARAVESLLAAADRVADEP